jgi:hypothetical protein
MYGTIGWNFIIATTSSLLTFFASLASNVLTTALLQSVYSFGVMFLVAFLFRFFVGLLMSLNIPGSTDIDVGLPSQDEIGGNFNMETPTADDYLQDILRQNYTGVVDPAQTEQFQPLNPTRLTTAPETQADNLVQAVRSSLRQE